MLAYACDPGGNGEHWLGWGWAQTAAQVGRVSLFTRSVSKATLQPHCDAAGIQLHCVDLTDKSVALSRRLGEAGSWWRKVAWAKKAAREVAKTKESFDCVHQTTFHTFRVPFYAASIGLPSVWGPVGGGEHAPQGFESFLGKAAKSERIRSGINRLCLEWPAVRKALRDSSRIYVSNRTTLAFLPKFARGKCVIVPANTVREEDAGTQPRARTAKNPLLELVYAGNCVATRCVPLVLEALRDFPGVHLTVAGEGPALEEWKSRAAQTRANVTFCGKVTRPELAGLYKKADALVFPALRDSGGSSLLEAMSIGLPVICLDWGGPGEVVDETSGIKIEVRNPRQVVADLRTAFQKLRGDESLRRRLAESGPKRARSVFSWESKRELLARTYSEITGL